MPLHSSVEAYREAIAARTAAQKVGLELQGPDAGKTLAARMDALEHKVKTLEAKLDRLQERIEET